MFRSVQRYTDGDRVVNKAYIDYICTEYRISWREMEALVRIDN